VRINWTGGQNFLRLGSSLIKKMYWGCGGGGVTSRRKPLLVKQPVSVLPSPLRTVIGVGPKGGQLGGGFMVGSADALWWSNNVSVSATAAN